MYRGRRIVDVSPLELLDLFDVSSLELFDLFLRGRIMAKGTTIAIMIAKTRTTQKATRHRLDRFDFLFIAVAG